MPMVPMNIDSSTLAVTSIITAIITFFFAATVGQIKPAAALAIAVIVGFILYATGVIPIGLLSVVGILMIVAIFKSTVSASASSEPVSGKERRSTLGYIDGQQQPTTNQSILKQGDNCVSSGKNTFSSWSDEKLSDFLFENGARRNKLMIDSTFDSNKTNEYQKLDEIYKAVDHELERRRSMPATMTPDAASWLNQNSDLVSQVAASHNIDVVKAGQLMIEMRKRFMDKLKGIGKHTDKKSVQAFENMVTKHFADEVRSKQANAGVAEGNSSK